MQLCIIICCRYIFLIECQNSRVENLLGKVGLKERLIDENHLEFIDALTDIDFGQVDHLIKREIQNSQQYLINALKIVQNERS